jgi:hypothetical protein
MVDLIEGLKYTPVKYTFILTRRRVFTCNAHSVKCGSDINIKIKMKLKRSINVDEGQLFCTHIFIGFIRPLLMRSDSEILRLVFWNV